MSEFRSSITGGGFDPAESATDDDAQIRVLARRMLDYRLPDDRLPLCSDRYPFRDLSLDVIDVVVRRALLTPELRGRLSASVRDVAGLATPVVDDYVVFEAHIDLTELDRDLNLALVNAGFEPDDFAKMEPAEYRHHFTLQYTVPMPSPRLSSFQRRVVDAGQAAATRIAAHAAATGYVELETYRSKYACRFPHREPQPSAEMHAPLSARFEIRDVPTDSRGSADTGLPLDVRRAADIHVKVPGRFPKYDGTPPAERLREVSDDHPVGRRRIKAALEAEGFYEIISQAGNYLYSAHFADLAEANAAYWDLVAFARECGGITSVAREVCTDVWRKRTQSPTGAEMFARVPPLLRGSWSTKSGSARPRMPDRDNVLDIC
jgi:hypothetical protein